MDNKQTIRVCALMLDPYDTNPGQRFRLEQWEPYLAEHDISVDYFPFTDEALRKILYRKGHFFQKVAGMFRALKRRNTQVRNAANYDLVYLFRAASMIGNTYFEKKMTKMGLPFIYDFDDAIYLTNTSKANRVFGWLKFPKKTADICRLSTMVIVGNSHLANYAKQYSKNVFVVPTSIDTDRYQSKQDHSNRETQIVLGWTGSSTSQYHLEEFEPILHEILLRYDVELRVISDRAPEFKTVKSVWQRWSAEHEVEITSQIDIGIMPIPNDEWSKGKCAAKALQYMALGIPTVCSDVGANKEVIKNGVNGFLADTSEDWINCVGKLVKDVGLRRQLGIEARRTVVEKYSGKRSGELFARLIRENFGKA